MPKSVPRPAAYTPGQRGLAAGILFGCALATIAVRRALRPHADRLGPSALGVLGWSPNFLAAVGSPFLWVTVNARVAWPLARWRFAPECFWVLVILLGYEAAQAFDPGQTFDGADVAASIIGVLVAYGIGQLVLRKAP